MRRLQIKFPNQIRISGWDFGSSARAMNQAGGFISTQADLEKVSKSTTERKSMSTKTTIKRIALVAVSALGLGVLTSVAPAGATERTATAVALGTNSPARVGAVVSASVTLTIPAASDNDTAVVAAKVISAPAGSGHNANTTAKLGNSSAANLYFEDTTAGLTDASADTDRTAAAGGLYPTAVSSVLVVNSSASPTSIGGTVNFIPDVAGTYQILVSAGNTTYTAGDASAIWTITTAGSVSTVVVTQVTSGAATGGQGAILKVQVKDSAGTTTNLTSSESITLASSVTTTAMTEMTSLTSNTASSGTADSVSIGASDFLNGAAYVRVTDSAEEDVVFTATGSGALASSITSNLTVSFTAATVTSGATLTKPTATGTTGYSSVTASGSYNTYTVPTTGASSTVQVNYTNSSTTAAAIVGIRVTDTDGKITGIAGGIFDRAVSVAASGTKATTALSHALSTVGQGFSVVVLDATSGSAETAEGSGLAYASAASSATASGATATAQGSSTISSATGATNTMSVQVKDQFGVKKANVTLTPTITGRNAAKSGLASIVTDAEGMATFSLADAGTSGTSDTVAISAGGSSTGASFTINYGTFTAGAITVTGGNTTDSVANATVTTNSINAGNTPEAGAISIVATVTDANGNLLAGVPVTFTVAGEGAAFLSTKKTVVTGTAGTATASLYAWKTGTYTYTATAGAKSTTGTATFASNTASYARTVAATASNGVVTATVTDRFGNVVSGVKIYAVATGGANIGGLFSTSGDTDSTGTVSFVVSGSGSVKVTTLNPASAAGTNPSDQTCALAGNLDCASGSTAATAFSAYVAGTSLVAEKYVGSTYAPAGVNAVTVDASATGSAEAVDAANEATDAANAATDAANAAAEAADAATAAAQDAQAAVAELATQVAALVAGIKAQITTLTNLVIKIQKKVKA